jgi:phosphatidylglycerophosphate synthase
VPSVLSVPSVFYALKAAAAFTAIMLVAAAGLREHHPFPRFGPANMITTLRALLVAIVAAFIGEPRGARAAEAVVIAGSIAAALDGVDGWLARRTDMASAFGARFDMEIDALLIQALAILAWQYGKAGLWVLASGLLRYAFVGAGWIVPWMRGQLTPTLRARVICIIQVGVLIVAMLPAVEPPASAWLAASGLLVLGYSFFVDILRLWRLRSSR